MFPKVAAGFSPSSATTSSPSNKPVDVMYALVDETSTMANNGKIALRANL